MATNCLENRDTLHRVTGFDSSAIRQGLSANGKLEVCKTSTAGSTPAGPSNFIPVLGHMCLYTRICFLLDVGVNGNTADFESVR